LLVRFIDNLDSFDGGGNRRVRRRSGLVLYNFSENKYPNKHPLDIELTPGYIIKLNYRGGDLRC